MRVLALFFVLIIVTANDGFGQRDVIEIDTVTVESSNVEDLADVERPDNLVERKSQKTGFRCSFLMLSNLAKAAEIIEDMEAFDCLNSLLVYDEVNRKNRKRIFSRSIETATHSTATLLVEHSDTNTILPLEMANLAHF